MRAVRRGSTTTRPITNVHGTSMKWLGSALPRTSNPPAAHEVEAHDETDLSTALDVVEHLLQTVYIIPKKAAKLRKKHS